MPASVALEICAFTSAGTAGVLLDPRVEPVQEARAAARSRSARCRATRRGSVPFPGALRPRSSRPAGAEDMITLPSCDISSPAPMPKNTSDTANAVPFRRHVDRPDQHERGDRHRGEADLNDDSRPASNRRLRAGKRCDQHRYRHREETLPGLERVEAEHDLEVHRQDEERAHHDQLLCGERGEPSAQRLDLQQRAIEERASLQPLATLLPPKKHAEHDQAAHDQERHQREYRAA